VVRVDVDKMSHQVERLLHPGEARESYRIYELVRRGFYSKAQIRGEWGVPGHGH